MKTVLSLLPLPLLLTAAGAESGQNLAQLYADYGRLIVTQFVSAPFPHASRAQGHSWGKDFFPADKHYSDSTVAIFIPRGLRGGQRVDFVVHFHGWGNHVSAVLAQHQLVEQLVASKRNAVLVVPQGPRDASDSCGGKLEDPDGFKRFMGETMATLRFRDRRAFHNSRMGNIILCGHSGGYRAIAFILAQGGVTENVREVWLFDGLYGQTEKFMDWFDRQRCRFVNIYTERGGTKRETEALMANLKGKGTPFLAQNDVESSPQSLQTNRLIFLYTDLSHNGVVNKRSMFGELLKTSCLGESSAR